MLLEGRVVVDSRVGRTCCWKVVTLLIVVSLEGRDVVDSRVDVDGHGSGEEAMVGSKSEMISRHCWTMRPQCNKWRKWWYVKAWEMKKCRIAQDS